MFVYKIYIEVLKFGDFNFDEFSIINKIDQNYNPAKKNPRLCGIVCYSLKTSVLER